MEPAICVGQNAAKRMPLIRRLVPTNLLLGVATAVIGVGLSCSMQVSP